MQSITKISWHQDGLHLAAGDTDGNVTVWHVGKKRPLKTFKGPSGVADLTWTSGGALLAVAFIGSPTMLVGDLKA